MPLLWLRVALGCYAVGLLYALLLVARRSELMGRIALHAAGVGMAFHLVSLTEAALVERQLTMASIHNSESLLAFVILLFFAAAIGQQKIVLATPLAHSAWIFVHIALIFTGYAALILSFGASLLYLLQERNLKSKQPGRLLSRLPSLQTIDDIGYRSLLLGFPFMTLGLIAGSVVAQAKFGAVYFRDPKVLLSVLMWMVYMIMLYTRWNSGWRGRRAAYLAMCAFVAAVVAWAANF